MLLSNYDSRGGGPLFAVSDEGSAGATVLEAAYASAKARAFPGIDPLGLGVILDGERMTSAGEVPIGPDEYATLNGVAAARLLCTTNVGVRANARLLQPLPELPLGKPDARWLEQVYACFAPFLETPNGQPRPLTIRLVVRADTSLAPLPELVQKLDAARVEGKIGPSDLHRLSLLALFDDEITTAEQQQRITQVIQAAADAGVPEVAIDGALRQAARLRVSVQSLLNVLDIAPLRELLREARTRGVRVTYRYQLDVESAARTIWTGLHAARTHGFDAGKYGLVPMTLGEQRQAVELITRWTRGWVAIPAFYVDTPLVTDDDVLDPSRGVEAAHAWLDMVHGAGVSLVLFDCPDRITPRKLLRQEGGRDDAGVLTLADVDQILEHARSLGIDILWSGGITSRQAFELARRRVHGIFSTSSTARKIAVSAPFAADPRLPAENEPTEAGVRRIHGIVQGGYLSGALRERDAKLAASIETCTRRLLDAEKDAAAAASALAVLDADLLRGWQSLGRPRPNAPAIAVVVPPDAVRVFRGRRRSALGPEEFAQALGSLFMPFTVQMQRLYGLTAYLPAVLPAGHAPALPDEIALVFYRTQAAYHDAKACLGGRAYSLLHDLVFDMGASGSGFPEPFVGTVEADTPYHLFPAPVDWQHGAVQVYVGTRPAKLSIPDFRHEVASRARRFQQSPGAVDAAILCTSADWLICWTHEPGPSAARIVAFQEVAPPVFAATAEPRAIPHALTVPYAGFAISPEGGFFNLQFPRD